MRKEIGIAVLLFALASVVEALPSTDGATGTLVRVQFDISLPLMQMLVDKAYPGLVSEAEKSLAEKLQEEWKYWRFVSIRQSACPDVCVKLRVRAWTVGYAMQAEAELEWATNQQILKKEWNVWSALEFSQALQMSNSETMLGLGEAVARSLTSAELEGRLLQYHVPITRGASVIHSTQGGVTPRIVLALGWQEYFDLRNSSFIVECAASDVAAWLSAIGADSQGIYRNSSEEEGLSEFKAIVAEVREFRLGTATTRPTPEQLRKHKLGFVFLESLRLPRVVGATPE